MRENYGDYRKRKFNCLEKCYFFMSPFKSCRQPSSWKFTNTIAFIICVISPELGKQIDRFDEF